MFRYVPSVKNNNALKDDFVKECNALLYRISRGRIDENLKNDSVNELVDNLRNAIDNLSGSLGTGKENVYLAYEKSKENLKKFEGACKQELRTVFEEAIDELIYDVDLWKDIVNDEVSDIDFDDEVRKETFARKKLETKLTDLQGIMESINGHKSRLDKEIVSLEKQNNEYDEMIVNEDNERKINEIYQSIQATKSKIEALNIRQANYASCYNVLDYILTNCKEIVKSSEYSSKDYIKAKAYLDIKNLQNIVSEPDKALVILKRIQKDLKELIHPSPTPFSPIISVESSGLSDALKYKEEKMKKKAEKAGLNEIISETTIDKEEIK